MSPAQCPDCWHVHVYASSLTTAQPRSGDLSICADCGAKLRFTKDLQLRRLSPTEYLDLKPRERFQLERMAAKFASKDSLI